MHVGNNVRYTVTHNCKQYKYRNNVFNYLFKICNRCTNLIANAHRVSQKVYPKCCAAI